MSMTTKDLALLINLHDSDEWKALKNLIQDHQVELALNTVQSGDAENLKLSQGQWLGFNWLVKTIDKIYKESKKDGKK